MGASYSARIFRGGTTDALRCVNEALKIGGATAGIMAHGALAFRRADRAKFWIYGLRAKIG
jgi:hypothetical protein